MDGWWCVRYGAALAWFEAPSAIAAMRRFLELHPFVGCTAVGGYVEAPLFGEQPS